jgi:glycosyltransferase involved in cell wall biosynthesis
LGRINKIKGLDVLIKSFSEILKEYKDFKLIIVGPDDGFLNSVFKIVNRLHIKDKVLFPGPLYNMEKLSAYVDADLLVYPAKYEIFGLVPFEAILCGTPVIVTDKCGCGEIIKSCQCGYLVKYGDITDLKEKIIFSIDHKDESIEKVNKGKNFIIETLNGESVTKKVEIVYENCIREL